MDTRRQNYFMRVALETAQLSYAKKLKVGAVAVREGRPICTGYNGTPPGEDNQCEAWVPDFDNIGSWKLKTRPEVEHAERNLIYFAAKKGIALEGASLFITHSPCGPCARAILNAGIAEVYFKDEFNDKTGLDFLRARINVFQVELVG